MKKIIFIIVIGFLLAANCVACKDDRNSGGSGGDRIPDGNEFWKSLRYDSVGKFSEGLAKTVKDGKTEYIDANGNAVFTVQCDESGDFSQGFAWYKKDGDGGYFDKQGKKIEPEIENFAIMQAFDFSENIVLVSSTGGYGTDTYFINKDGSQYSELPKLSQSGDYRPFSEGLCGYMPMSGYLWGFRNKVGDIVIKPEYMFVSAFRNGLSKVQKDASQQVVFINRDGECIFATQSKNFLKVGECYEERIWFFDGNLYGYYDNAGRIVIEPMFKSASDFLFGYALVKKQNYEIIDLSGKTIYNFLVQDAFLAGDSVIAYKENGKWGYVDINGKIVQSPVYDRVSVISDGFATVKIGNYWGFYKYERK
jgi:hypothetical protein